MSAASVQQVGDAPRTSSRWIINWWVDQSLIIFTPLISALVVFTLASQAVGVTAATISLIVTSFFALGHHLPGMMRAYGDRDLFQRFRWRLILVPPIVFGIFFPLYSYHFNAFRLLTIGWATWHGLMQLYGFARIYDMKVGSNSKATIYWDWLLCLVSFLTAQVLSPVIMSTLLEHWYGMGGPLIPPMSIWIFQRCCLALLFVVLAGFTINSIVQSIRGQPPSPIKFLMLASGIGFWWFAATFVENLVLGIALFDISHDVQYDAIVWLFNCRRVNSTPNVGRFMKTVFRRGMVSLYIGLIVAYGAIGLVPSLVQDETIKIVFTGFLWTSTILHYYMDGFIWKIRESTNRSNLGLNGNSGTSPFQVNGFVHLLKWSPLIGVVGWLFVADLDRNGVSVARAKELDKLYTDDLAMTNSLPSGKLEQSWIFSRFQQVLNIAEAVPSCAPMQIRAAVMLANFGRNEEAIVILEKELSHDPKNPQIDMLLGFLQIKTGNLDAAQRFFELALNDALTDDERMRANMGLGEVYICRKEFDLAKSKFDEALRYNPQLEASVKLLLERHSKSKAEEER